MVVQAAIPGGLVTSTIAVDESSFQTGNDNVGDRLETASRKKKHGWRTAGGGPFFLRKTRSRAGSQPAKESPPRQQQRGIRRRWRSNDSPRETPQTAQPISIMEKPNEKDQNTRNDSNNKKDQPSERRIPQTRVFTVRSRSRKKNQKLAGPLTPENSPARSSKTMSSLVDKDEESGDNQGVIESPERSSNNNDALKEANCATAIFQHSYLEFCGSQTNQPFGSSDCRPEQDAIEARNSIENQPFNQNRYISDDPTVQESIECVFASKIGENLALMLEDDNSIDEDYNDNDLIKVDTETSTVVAPSVLHQSLLRNRSERALESLSSPKKSKRRSKKLQESVKLVHVGTFDPNDESGLGSHKDARQNAADANKAARGPSSTIRCACCKQRTPLVGEDRWPQRPLLLRSTPNSGTVVKGIRKAGSDEYLWSASSKKLSTLSWPSALRRGWGMGVSDTENNPMEVMCESCMILPINNGNEAPGETLVTDFESELFSGTLLLRVRNSEGTTPEPYSDECDGNYFHGMNRRYQAVIRGRFKEAIPFTKCLTGFVLERPCGQLPPKWILKGALKLLSFFAPQLQAKLDGPNPSSLTPLGSTPQVLRVQEEHETGNIEDMQFEPTDNRQTLLGESLDATGSLQRARHRKKQFDKLFTQKSLTPLTEPNKVYSFEFLQHLFNFNEFSIELGSMFGSIQLKEVLDGQPMQIMASYGEKRLWSFDIWHTSLLEDSRKHDGLS